MKRGVILVIGLAVFIGLIVLIFVLARGQKSSTATSTNLSVWMPYDETKTYQTISQDFLKANPGVQLNFKYVEAKDAKDYEAKVVDALANGNGPDIWLIRNDWIPKHVDKSLPAFTADSKTDPITLLKQRIMPSVIDANTYNGKLYGVPLAGDALAIIYNEDFYNRYYDQANDEQKAVLKKLASSWEELKIQTAGISRSNGATVTRSAIALGTTENTFAPADVVGAFLVQSGSTVLTSDQKNINFNLAVYKNGSPTFPSTDALDYYTSFARPGQSNYSWSTSMGDPVDAFLNQKTGALIGYYSTLKQIMEKKPGFVVKVSPLVQKDPKADRVDYGVTWSHIVNKDTANPNLAWSYLSYLGSQNVLNSYTNLTGKVSIVAPGSPLTFSDVWVDASQGKDIYRTELQTMKSLPKPEWQQTDEILQDMIKQVVDSGQTSQNSVDTAAERFKKAFLGL